ncbi:MAG: hypothetical protein JO054_18850 [Actinobacteria bacterium]|nr:hypothetical protein [Actinomycetota bacterium]
MSSDEDLILELSPQRVFAFGRNPKPEGLVLDPQDLTLSATAGEIRWMDGDWILRNTSSHARLRLDGSRGVRDVVPGEAISLEFEDAVIVPTRAFNHQLKTHLPRGARAVPGGSTMTIGDIEIEFSEPQLRAVAALVVGWFVPARYDPVPLPASEIQRLLSLAGEDVTKTGVYKRLDKARAEVARVRGDLTDGFGAAVSLPVLAQTVVKYGIVTQEMIQDFFGLA